MCPVLVTSAGVVLTRLRQFVLMSTAVLSALMLLVQPAASEMRGWPGEEPSDPSHGNLCVCAVISGYGPVLSGNSKDDAEFWKFIRDGRNSCHWRSQQGDHESPCVVHLYEFFTASGTCAEHTGTVVGKWNDSISYFHSGCLMLTETPASCGQSTDKEQEYGNYARGQSDRSHPDLFSSSRFLSRRDGNVWTWSHASHYSDR